jgi:glucose-1-phosphate thymidylyltransferase
VAKQLLPVGGRPVIDYIVDAIREVDEIEAIHVVTNRKFAQSFAGWAAARGCITVHDDGTTSEDDRLGAVGDIAFVVDRAGLNHDDLLVIAGDNLFDYSLREFVTWWSGKGEASGVVLYDVGDLELVTQYSSVDVDVDERLTALTEKPEHPTSTLVATAAYIYHRSHVALLHTYLSEAETPDQPGRFLAWLVPRAPVYGFTVSGEWHDIGDANQLLEADNRYRERAGLPTRSAYSL